MWFGKVGFETLDCLISHPISVIDKSRARKRVDEKYEKWKSCSPPYCFVLLYVVRCGVLFHPEQSDVRSFHALKFALLHALYRGSIIKVDKETDQLTLNLLTWRIWWAPNNASNWQTGFNSEFKGLILGVSVIGSVLRTACCVLFIICICQWCRSQWPRGLRRRSAAARLLRSWVRIPPGAWMFVCCELSGRGLCDELITRPEESYRLWCVVVCDLETSRMRRPLPALGRSATAKKITQVLDWNVNVHMCIWNPS